MAASDIPVLNDNAICTVDGGVSIGATEIALVTGDGANLPVDGSCPYPVTIYDLAPGETTPDLSTNEELNVTGRSGDTLTVDATSAAWGQGGSTAYVAQQMTKSTLDLIRAAILEIEDGSTSLATLTVTGKSTLTDDVTIGDGYVGTGALLTAAGAASFKGALTADGAGVIGGTLTLGSDENAVSTAAGKLAVGMMEPGTIGAGAFVADAVKAVDVDEAEDYTVHDLDVTGDVDVTGDLTAGVDKTWRRFLFARDLWPGTSSPCGGPTRQAFASRSEAYTMDFDAASSSETACGELILPSDYDGSALTVSFYWTAIAGTSGVVKWMLYNRCVSDDDTLGITYGSAIFTDTFLAQDDLHVCSISFTPGSAAAGALMQLAVLRHGSDAGDTFDADANLIGISFRYS